MYCVFPFCSELFPAPVIGIDVAMVPSGYCQNAEKQESTED